MVRSQPHWKMAQKMRTGIAKVSARVTDHGRTALTEMVHRAPARVHPLKTPGAEKAGAAWCMLGEYGGGLLGGDQMAFTALADAGATLTLSTQGATKVVKSPFLSTL